MATAEQEQAVADGIALIKGNMPETFKAINAKSVEIGKAAFGLVRRSLRGEAGCFYAIERGYVVGTPFRGHPIMADVAQAMVDFGSTYVCIWPAAQPGATDGTH